MTTTTAPETSSDATTAEPEPEAAEALKGDRRSRLEKHRNRRPIHEKFLPRAIANGYKTNYYLHYYYIHP